MNHETWIKMIVGFFMIRDKLEGTDKDIAYTLS
jgi:hypothetical protein